jgi:hypothetical protein
MRIPRFILIVPLICAAFPVSAISADETSPLTAAELAEVLGVHWWAIKLPDTTRPGDGLSIQWIDSNGTGLAGGSATIANTSMTPGAIVKIYCREETGHPAVTITTPNGELNTAFPDISLAGVTFAGLPNGTVAKSGDILLKLVKRAPDGTLTLSPADHLNPGDFGLRVAMHPGPRN